MTEMWRVLILEKAIHGTYRRGVNKELELAKGKEVNEKGGVGFEELGGKEPIQRDRNHDEWHGAVQMGT